MSNKLMKYYRGRQWNVFIGNSGQDVGKSQCCISTLNDIFFSERYSVKWRCLWIIVNICTWINTLSTLNGEVMTVANSNVGFEMSLIACTFSTLRPAVTTWLRQWCLAGLKVVHHYWKPQVVSYVKSILIIEQCPFRPLWTGSRKLLGS